VAKPRDVVGTPLPGEPKSGVYRVLAAEAIGFLRPFDVQAVPGIGPVTAAQLRKMGVNRVGQLLDIPQSVLRRVYGSGVAQIQEALLGTGEDGPAESYFGYGNGQSLQGRPPSRPKSIGHETTLERDEIDPAVFEQTLWRLTEDACRRLRAADLRAAHVTVKLRYSDFDTHTHGAALPGPADTEAGIFPAVIELFAQAHTRRLRVRLLGVRLERLSAGASQGALFETGRERREHALSMAVDSLRERFGRDMLLAGPGVHRLGKPSGTSPTMPTPGGFNMRDFVPQQRLPLGEAA
jgi:DNA polymerase-4